MRLVEKVFPAQVQDFGKHKKVKVITAFLNSETQAKVGTITRTFTCSSFEEGSLTMVVNQTEFKQLVTVYRDGKEFFTRVEDSWNKALDIINRETTPWGRFINHWFL